MDNENFLLLDYRDTFEVLSFQIDWKFFENVTQFKTFFLIKFKFKKFLMEKFSN